MTLVQGLYARTPVNRSDIPQNDLNIEAKIRSNPFPWSGQFSPQLVQALLGKYASRDSVILDPFLGSGTVLLEAARIGLPAFGGEINPAAVTMAKTYQFANVSTADRKLYIEEISGHLEATLPDALPLFQTSEALKTKLINIALRTNGFQQMVAELLIVMVDFHKPAVSLERIFQVWEKLTTIILTVPYSQQPIRAFNSDVRNLPLADSSVNLVLTSPPYINVFNYHQRFRRSMEALRWNLLQVAQSEFGANRKHRGNRFLTVVQFCLDIAQALAELSRVCSPDSRLIFVVGRESKVRGTRFFNGEIVCDVAHQVLGLELTLRQERMFLNRYGQRIFEDILHFSNPGGPTNLRLKEAREVARNTLEAAYATVPTNAATDIKSALINIDNVAPSPLFNCHRSPDLIASTPSREA